MRVAIVAAIAVAVSGAAFAKTFVVNATDDIYAVGQSADPGGGTVPHGFVPLPVGAKCFDITRITGSIHCASPNGCITLNKSLSDNNDPDGNGSQASVSSSTGTANFSGLRAPHDGYLVGLFVSATSGQMAAPAALDFTTGETTRFKTLSPLLNQTFFVGDGRTGSANGAKQRFMVPDGATRVYFGISDGCGFSGSPNCYFDNAGTYTVSVTRVSKDCVDPPS